MDTEIRELVENGLSEQTARELVAVRNRRGPPKVMAQKIGPNTHGSATSRMRRRHVRS